MHLDFRIFCIVNWLDNGHKSRVDFLRRTRPPRTNAPGLPIYDSFPGWHFAKISSLVKWTFWSLQLSRHFLCLIVILIFHSGLEMTKKGIFSVVKVFKKTIHSSIRLNRKAAQLLFPFSCSTLRNSKFELGNCIFQESKSFVSISIFPTVASILSLHLW